MFSWSTLPYLKAWQAAASRTLPDYLLKRQIHRLEKGLVLARQTNSRQAFGKEYLLDLIELLQATKNQRLASWARSCLQEYTRTTQAADWNATVFETFGGSAQSSSVVSRYQVSPTHPEFLDELIEKRRSIRKFEEQEIQPELLESVLAAAYQGPSACNRHAFNLHVFTGTTTRKILDLTLGAKFLTAPHVIVVTAQCNAYAHTRDLKCPIIDASLGAMLIQLKATASALGTLMINWPEDQKIDAKFRSTWRIGDSEVILFLLAIGYPSADAYVSVRLEESSVHYHHDELP